MKNRLKKMYSLMGKNYRKYKDGGLLNEIKIANASKQRKRTNGDES